MTHDEYILERDKSYLYSLFKKCEELSIPIKISYNPKTILWHVEGNINGKPYIANGDIRSIAADFLEQLL